MAASWPVPFASDTAALRFFGGGTGGRAWADGLGQTADGWRPRFDVTTVTRALDEVTARSWWDEWEAITCPTMLVRGARGWLHDREVERMASTGPRAQVVEVADSGHDVHLDQPDRVARLILAHTRGPR